MMTSAQNILCALQGDVSYGYEGIRCWHQSSLYMECLKICPLIHKDFFLSLFILREREREHIWRRAEKGRDRNPSRLCALTHKCEIMTWTEIKSQQLNWLSHPGAPNSKRFLKLKRKTSVWIQRGQKRCTREKQKVHRSLFILHILTV